MNKSLFIFLLFFWFLFSCTRQEKKIVQSDTETLQNLNEPTLPIHFLQQEDSFPYAEAILELYTPLGNQVFKPGKVPFEFNVKNFTLEKNSGSTPRLFMILNGGDPIGYHSSIFQRELTVGTYRLVAFLVDEQGIALRNFGNYIDRDFLVGDSRPFPYSAEPYLALNHPKNNQIIAFGEDLVIDFLVLAGDMMLDDLKVRVFVNELAYESVRMAPIRVENLPKGDYQIKVQLLRSDDKELEGPFSVVTKTIFIR